MGLEDVWNRFRSGSKLSEYWQIINETRSTLASLSRGDMPDDFDIFMTAVRGLTESPATHEVFKMFGTVEGADARPEHLVSSGLMSALSDGDASGFSLDEKQLYIDHLLGNDKSFMAMQMYPALGMAHINNVVNSVEEMQGFMILTDTERGRHGQRFVNLIERAVADGSGDHAAVFFTSLMTDEVDEGFAIERLQKSRAFQAGAQDTKFLDHITHHAPVLTAAALSSSPAHTL